MAESAGHQEARAFLAKARQNLAAAETEYAAERYDACANRAYYCCFQAAIAALLVEGIRPAGRASQWTHQFVQAQFSGVLVGRRKRYAAALHSFLKDNLAARHQADYRPQPVSQRDASRVLRQAGTFAAAVEEQMPWQHTSSG